MGISQSMYGCNGGGSLVKSMGVWVNARGGLLGTSNMYALRLFIHELFPRTCGNSADCILKGFGNWNFLERFFK